MKVNIQFKKVGDPTDCTPLDFVIALQEKEPLHKFVSAEEKQIHFKNYFESLERFEYTVYSNEGKLLAIMVIAADFDHELGQLCLVPTTAYSLHSGLLTGAYRFLFNLAKERRIGWVRYSKTEGLTQTIRYKCIKM